MRIRYIQIFAALCIFAGASAFAQDRVVPESRNDVQMSFAPVVKKISPAVVNIYTKRTVTQRLNPFLSDPFFEQLFGGMGQGGLSRQQVESSLGSGVIVDANGLIVTNSHVIKDATEIMIVLNDGREFDASVSLVDERSDLALLRVDPKGERLPFASLEPSENLEVGDIVLAVGNPFGVGQTVTSGIVSALARSSLHINDFNFFIQTDAAINPGNSGGPLVDMNGGIVGINTAIFSQSGGSLGIGFAIPSEMVATVVAAEKTGEHTSKSITRAWLGINGQRVTADIAASLDLPRPVGVLISKVHENSPLKAEGMEVGDVVTAIDGKIMRDPAEMKFRLATLPIGQETKIDVMRKGKPLSFTVKVIAPPETPAREEATLRGAGPLTGAMVSNINPAVAIEYNIEDAEEGVVITGVEARGRAARLVRSGDIILAINNRPVKKVGDVKTNLEKAMREGVVGLLIDRDGRKAEIVLR